jgi:Midasin AAA lid domain
MLLNCSTSTGDLQLAALVHSLCTQVAGLRLGRHFSIRDVIKWCRRMQASCRSCIGGLGRHSCSNVLNSIGVRQFNMHVGLLMASHHEPASYNIM